MSINSFEVRLKAKYTNCTFCYFTKSTCIV